MMFPWTKVLHAHPQPDLQHKHQYNATAHMSRWAQICGAHILLCMPGYKGLGKHGPSPDILASQSCTCIRAGNDD